MARRQPTTSAARAKRKSRRIQNATIGTHVFRTPASSKKTETQPSGFASPRKSARAKRGFVDLVGAKSTTAESESEYAKRVNRRDFTQNVQRKASRKRVFAIVAALLLVVVVAGSIGSFVYMGSVSNKMALSDDAAKAALVAPKEGEPTYILFAGEFSETGQDYKGPDLLMLLRVDKETNHASLLYIPSNLLTDLSDNKTHWISEAQVLGGDAALIKAVSGLTKTSISHYVKTDAAQFEKIVDSLGGVNVKVTEEVDDPAAGDIYIPAGSRTLDGKEALTYCRATNFASGVDQRTMNQVSFALALGEKMLDNSGLGAVFALDKISNKIKTDLSAGDALAIADELRGISAEDVYTAQIPGYTNINTATGAKSISISSSSWDKMRTTFKEGGDIANLTSKTADVDPASFTITVRNGSGVTGGAKQVSDALAAGGFNVTETGNADSFVYDETLVVYDTDDKAAAAETVVNNLGVGRAVESGSFYSFSTDVLVMVGKDWKPLN